MPSYTYLRAIDASGNNLEEIPEPLGSLPCLNTLNLSNNLLAEATNWDWTASPFMRENLFTQLI